MTTVDKNHQISKESMNELNAFFLKHTNWVLREIHQEDDYGFDGEIDIVDEERKWTTKMLRFQLKSTFEGPNSYKFETERLDEWGSSAIPVFVFFWNKDENSLYYFYLQNQYSVIKRTYPEKLLQKTISIPFIQRLTSESVEDILQVININNSYIRQAIEYGQRQKDKQLVQSVVDGFRLALGKNFENQDLSGQDLRNASVMGTNFKNTKFISSDLRGIAAMGADFTEATMKSVDLRGGSVMGAFFERADLRNAKLENTAFMGAYMSGADVRGAVFNELSLWSLNSAYDIESAKFDEGVLDKIKSMSHLKNYNGRNS